MLLLTARIFPRGSVAPMYDATVKSQSMLLEDGRTVYLEVRKVECAFEIEEAPNA